MGIASLILGIVSIVWSCLGGTWISALIGVAGIVLGAIGKKKNSSCSVAGLVLSIIGCAIGMAWYIACVACATAATAAL